MSIIPASSLTATELLRLGNNLRPALRKDRRELLAINRSLAAHDAQVQRLHRPCLNAGSWAGIVAAGR